MFQHHSIPLLTHLRLSHRPMHPPATENPAAPTSATPTETPTETPTPPFPFLALPLELRETIYSLYFRPADRLRKSAQLETQGFYGGVYAFETAVFGTCRQVNREARRVWRREVRTVKVGTPWVSAGECCDC